MAKNRKRRSDKKRDIWKKSNGVCAHCGKQAVGDAQTIDHVIPKTHGGTDDQRNLMPLCQDCNKQRSNAKIEPREYYSYASEWAHEDLDSYIFEFRMAHTNASGEPVLEHEGAWMF